MTLRLAGYRIRRSNSVVAVTKGMELTAVLLKKKLRHQESVAAVQGKLSVR